MKYLNDTDIARILADNEKENLFYEIVEAKFKYELSDNNNNEGSQIETQKMIKIKKDGENVFIMSDRYKDYAPFDFMIKENQLADTDYKVISKHVHSFEVEKKRINTLLAKEIGGVFDKRHDKNFTRFRGYSSITQELENYATSLKDEHLNKFYEKAVGAFSNKENQNSNDLKPLSETFNTSISHKISEMHDKYLFELNKRELETLEKNKRDMEDRLEQARVQALVKLQSTKSEVLEQFGYYPTVVRSREYDENLIININDSKNEIIDSFNIKLDLRDEAVGYDVYDDTVYETFATVNLDSIDLIDKAKIDKYYPVVYLLENSVITYNENTIDTIKKATKKEVELEKDFEIVLKSENSLIFSMRNEFKNETTLENVNNMHKEFKESIKPKPRSKLTQ